MSESKIITAIAEFKRAYSEFDPSLLARSEARSGQDDRPSGALARLVIGNNTSLADFQREYQARAQSDSKDL